MKKINIHIVLIVFFISCQNEDQSFLFKIKKSEETGIEFANKLKDTPELNILTYLYYYNGGGVASGDFNNDGLQDLYFTANQGKNKLYLNQGRLKFQDVTSDLLSDSEGWTTGVTTVDVNQDGWLDIYVCKVGGYQNFKGKNKLFLNQGVDDKGIPSFKEVASYYNLDSKSLSTQASFFDYDLDGDLDMYLLNHSVHPNRTYGRGSKRKQINSVSGDRLYRNDRGLFRDVSQEAGIYQGTIGYGLGIATSDINNDGYPDIYISNDFFENDYLYINQKNGTFKEVITSGKKNISHTSHFSMGVDIADINNDGMTDILSLDMLSEDLETYRSSGTEYSFSIYNQYLKNGYQPQYMQNTLQLNRGNSNFSEIAFFSGIAATDWSWAPQIVDYDNDGFKDVFISNGIIGATNDMDFISFIANDNIQKRIRKGMKKEDLALINELPDKKAINYFYKNNGDLTFDNVSDSWADPVSSYSAGAIYVDLDNDGDMDIVTNNCNEPAFVYENQTNTKTSNTNYIQLKLKGTDKNINAIGAKASVYTKNGVQTSEVFTTRGYLSAVSPLLHFGLGQVSSIDSIKIQWPGGKNTVYKEKIAVNSIIKLDIKDGFSTEVSSLQPTYLLKKDTIAIGFKHQDYETKDFNYETLAPYASSNEGPHLSVLDINNDSLTDVFIPGGRFQAGELWIQKTNGSFDKVEQPEFELDKKREDIDACFFEADKDGDLDLLIVSGGNETLYNESNSLQLYSNEKGVFQKKINGLPELAINSSVVIASDIDNDGDQDVFIGSFGKSGAYGQTATNYILDNDGEGNFSVKTDVRAPGLKNIGQVSDAKFIDINKDSFLDLVIVGHYMPITIFMNDGSGKLVNNKIRSLQNTNGWWNCIKAFDADLDGDLDLIAGNWGLNSRLKVSKEEPIRLYLNDFDSNGRIDPIVTYFYHGKETPIANTDELTKQLPILNKKYTSYGEFAKSNVQDYFPKLKFDEAKKKEVFTLNTTYFENTGDLNFVARELPKETQISSVHDILIEDINQDNFPDLILGGNTYELNTQLSRLDASYGLVLLNDTKGSFSSDFNYNLNINGAVRSIKPIKIKGHEYFLFGVNNDSLQVVKKIKK